MVMPKHKHSFAKVWLDRLGNKITINGVDFLGHFMVDDKKKSVKHLQKRFSIRPLKTEIVMGEELLNEEELAEITILSYSEMKKKFGLGVFVLPVDSAAGRPGWKKRQQYIYVIGKRRPGLPEMPDSSFGRRGFRIEWNKAEKCVRGIGEGFGTPEGKFKAGDITPWICYGERPKKPKNRQKYFPDRDDYEEISEDLIDMWEGKELIENKILKIPELPVLITEEGELLCMPKTKVLPVMLIVGKRGKGKSWALSSIGGRIVYIFQDRAGMLNDSLNQFYDLMMPMEQQGFINELARVGNEPKFLPTINLYMSCPKVKMKYTDENIGYRLVISFKDFLKGWKYYTHGIARWDLGKTESYMTNDVINAIKDSANAKEVKDNLFNVLPVIKDDGKKNDGMINMIMRWHSKFDNILRDEFMSNLFKHERSTAPYWKAVVDGEELVGHPFIIAMEAGLVPVINNYLAKSYPIAKKQMVDLINRIVRWQMERDEKKRRMWILVDELKDFLGKKSDELYGALDYIFTQSRINKIGFVGNIQEYTKLSPSMRANATHLIIFELQTNEERRAVAKDYGLEPGKLEEIANLKTFQCLFTTKEKVVLYDKDGRRRVEEGGIWRGKVLPPITCHKSP